MPSRFPGIDPFLEGQLWADFHNRFIVALSEDILRQVDDRYLALIEERVYLEQSPEQPLSHIRPDVAVVTVSHPVHAADRAGSTAPVVVPLLIPERLRETFVELRLRGTRELVTIIEVLSPSNKRAGSDGRREYLAKRAAVHQSAVHLVEIDLLRGGSPLPMGGPLPPAYGHVIVSRAGRRPLCDVWPVNLRDPLPTIDVPLAADDASVPVDLQTIFGDVFDRARYSHALDYGQALEPPVAAGDRAWVRTILEQA